MIKFILVSALICAATSVSAQQNSRSYNNSYKPPVSSPRTFPNYEAPKSDFKNCKPVVVTEYNVFTKQPYQVVKCY